MKGLVNKTTYLLLLATLASHISIVLLKMINEFQKLEIKQNISYYSQM